MTNYDNIPDEKLDEALLELSQKNLRKTQLERTLKRLREEEERLCIVEAQRREESEKEQNDVDALSNNALLLWWLSLTKQKEARMEKEESEALEARAIHEEALIGLETVRTRIKALENEKKMLGLCREHYAEVLERKKQMLASAPGNVAEDILKLEGQLAAKELECRELDEVIGFGENLYGRARAVEQSLKEAERVSANASRRRHTSWQEDDYSETVGILDHAQKMLDSMQRDMSMFRSRLADFSSMADEADLRVTIPGGNLIGGYVLEVLTLGIAPSVEMEKDQADVRRFRAHIGEVVDGLRTAREGVGKERELLRTKLERLVRENHV